MLRNSGEIQIGTLRFDPVSRDLRDGSGARVGLRNKSSEVLTILAAKPGELVTKSDIMEAVWPDVTVTDESLTQCVADIRRAIEDKDQTLLKTHVGKGYSLEVGPAAATPKSHMRWRLAGIVAAVAVALSVWVFWPASEPAGPPVVAVLPFDNFGIDPEQVYLANGLTEDLITDLARRSELLVIARNSVWPYRGEGVDVRDLGRNLGASHVVEGSVRRDNNRIRINVQLIDVKDGQHLWAERFDGPVDGSFAFQDGVVGQIISALSLKLNGQDPTATAEHETSNPQAYDAFLRGRDYLNRDTETDTLKAIELFQRAVELDPGYSRAYAALAAANLRIVLSLWYVSSGTGWQHAYDALEHNLARAMENPTSLAYLIRALMLHQQGRYEEALGDAAQAEALSPGDTEVHVIRARILNALGRAEEAEKEIRFAMRLDPGFSPALLRVLSMTQFHLRRYAEAIETIERILAQDAGTLDDYQTLVAAMGHLDRREGLAEAISTFNGMALEAAFDPLTAQESRWYWNGDSFSYHTSYIEDLVTGLSRAGVPEGAGTDIPVAQYKGLITRQNGLYTVAGANRVDASEVRGLLAEGAVLVDVRSAPDHANGHIPGAANLSLVTDLAEKALETVVAKDRAAIFHCHGRYCPYSAYASAKALVWGWRNVHYFAGGYPEWVDAGYPVVAE